MILTGLLWHVIEKLQSLVAFNLIHSWAHKDWYLHICQHHLRITSNKQWWRKSNQNWHCNSRRAVKHRKWEQLAVFRTPRRLSTLYLFSLLASHAHQRSDEGTAHNSYIKRCSTSIFLSTFFHSVHLTLHVTLLVGDGFHSRDTSFPLKEKRNLDKQTS